MTRLIGLACLLALGAACAGLVDADNDGASAAEDCDDNDVNIGPLGKEVCDAAGVDEDCDGLVNEADPSVDVSTAVAVWIDADGDGFGDARADQQATCGRVNGYVGNNDDCDDADRAISPDADEVCDTTGVDEDCDGVADTSTRSWWPDGDGDGFGDADAAAVTACAAPGGSVDNDDDCDDADAAISPGSAEVCDAANADEDCDGRADDADSSVASATLAVYYDDGDRDGWGEDAVTYRRCDPSASMAAVPGDCNDGDAATHPGAAEVCDLYIGGRDEDCDGLINDLDPSTSEDSKTQGYVDADGDGQGAEDDAGVGFCVVPQGYVANADDCDDARPGIYTSPMSGLCGASITDPNSPYYENVCDFSQYQTRPSELIIDCRCPWNTTVADQCTSPNSIPANHTIGAGPTMRGALGVTWVGGGGPDVGRGEIIYAFSWDDGANGSGMVWALDWETGDRRIVSGQYLDPRAGLVEYGSGPPLYQTEDLEVAADGYYYVVATAPNADEEVVRVDPATGARTVMWRENDPGFAQCDNGNNGVYREVQVNRLGFEVGDDGTYYFGVLEVGGGGQGPSIVAISPDGQSCRYVTRFGAEPTNRFFNQNVGGGWPLAQGRYEALEWVDGYLYAIDFISLSILRVDPATGDRYMISSSTDGVGVGPAIGTRWIVHDPVRDVLWTSGLSPEPADIYSVDYLNTGDRRDLTCFAPYAYSWEMCLEGPAITDWIKDNGIFVRPTDGKLIAGHHDDSFVIFEPETGNSNVFSF